MAFGALLGASTYVCMNVVGMIIQLKPAGPMQANPAVVRDIAGYLVLLLCMLPIFTSGLSRSWVITLNSLYAALTGMSAPLPALPFHKRCICLHAYVYVCQLRNQAVVVAMAEL